MTELAGVPSILPLLRRLSGPLECGDTDTVPVPSVLQIVTVAFIFSRSPFAHAMLLSLRHNEVLVYISCQCATSLWSLKLSRSGGSLCIT